MKKIKLIRLKHNADNSSLIQRLLENAPTYCLNTSGKVAESYDGEEVFKAMPPNFLKEDKHVLGIYEDERLIGMIDCLIGYPSKEKAHLGLLLLDEGLQMRGLGKLAFQGLEDYLRSFESINKIRLGVVKTNDQVLPFWEKMGFELASEIKPFSHKMINSEVILMEKSLR